MIAMIIIAKSLSHRTRVFVPSIISTITQLCLCYARKNGNINIFITMINMIIQTTIVINHKNAEKQCINYYSI